MKMDIISIGNITIHGYGLMIAVGILLCVMMAVYRAKKYSLDPEAMVDIALWGVASGFVGAKLLYVIVEWKEFIKHPGNVLGSEGFVVYGGIIAGVLAAILYCRIKHLIFLEYFDLAAPSIALAQGVGRIGCFLAGCCYGRETDSFLGVVFPEGCMAPTGVKLLPTQLFSSAGDLLIMGILLWFHRKNTCTGNVGALYMALYGVGRFLIEFLRADDRGGLMGLSTSQLISILIVAGAVVLFWRNRRAQAKGRETGNEI